MRWKSELIPEYNQMKLVLKFAFFPTQIGDEWIWFENYWQQYKSNGNNTWHKFYMYPYEDYTPETVKEINSAIKYKRRKRNW